MKQIIEDYIVVGVCFIEYALACVILAIVTLINLPSLFRRKDRK